MGLAAFVLSTITLLASAAAHLGLMQSEGGIVDSCNGVAFVDVSFDKCQAIGAAIAASGEVSGRAALLSSRP